MRTFELMTGDGDVVRWSGDSGEDAAARAADCLRVSVVAWRNPPVEFVPGVDPRSIIG